MDETEPKYGGIEIKASRPCRSCKGTGTYKGAFAPLVSACPRCKGSGQTLFQIPLSELVELIRDDLT